MTELEKRFAEEKERLQEVKAPAELGDRLRYALEQTPVRRKRTMPKWIAVAVALLLVSVVSYNYNAFAYYGKKLFGFDEIMTGTLSQLNEEGRGQPVDGKLTFQDGSTLKLEGILSDENQFILYYTITNPAGINANPDYYFTRVTGRLTDASIVSSVASLNDEGTELKGMQTFEPVSPFAKKLTVHLTENQKMGNVRDMAITFPYNPNAAMETVMKQAINGKVQVDQGTIYFDKIIATPSRTTVTGKLKVANFDRYPSALEGVQLMADGKVIEWRGSGTSTALNGQSFEIHYDALPEELEELKVVVDTFVGYTDVNELIPLDAINDESLFLNEKELIIKKVEKASDGIHVTIATAEDVMLKGVSIQVNDDFIPLKTTVRQDTINHYKERMLLFEGDELPDALYIEGMHYEKKYGDKIDIKVK